MREKFESISGRTLLTRISVSSNGSYYLVRNGDETPVRVWMHGESLHCECGQRNCSHIASLEMCGFVEPPYEERRAA